ncbi:hypothetical protein E1281_24815 [Actinomadura sp. KC345]|uniref:hypothetical protein n=1 Tax=Actinomadura sp. KC345 TaxID=2530371 RepID=UPI0010492550|nr:hypothetical protein [Actinomadura sp. KC345]TDC48408.1 hypothetical protein E1281_24815 [Actinomadura sp. KC345]
MRKTPLGRAALVTITGLVTAAAGLVIQKVAGVEMPPVPPGLVILTLVTALIAVTPWRWPLVLAVLAALAEVPGALGSAADAGTFGEVAGAAVRTAGAVTAFVAGIAAAAVAYRSRKRAPESAAR